MKISVIICTLNNWQQLNELLYGINDQNYLPYEVIVVHGERDEMTKRISYKWNDKKYKIKYITAPRSLVIQRNIGIDKAIGNIICFLDDDVVLEQNYFLNILKTYQSNIEIVGVQGTITNNKKINFLKKIFYSIFLLDDTYGNGKLKKSGLPSFLKPTLIPTEVEIFNGCLMSFRAFVVKNNKFDLFYEKNWWGDDYETSYNISKKYKLLQIPDARLFHYGNASFSRSPTLAYMRGKNLSYIREKHGLCRGANKLFCLWSDIGQFLLYFILFIKGDGFKYLIYWFKGLKTCESS